MTSSPALKYGVSCSLKAALKYGAFFGFSRKIKNASQGIETLFLHAFYRKTKRVFRARIRITKTKVVRRGMAMWNFHSVFLSSAPNNSRGNSNW